MTRHVETRAASAMGHVEGREIFLRFDVEDWLTEAADWALDGILDVLEDLEIRANFAVVGMKARSLIGKGRGSWLDRMGHLGTLGYHSWSHSVHPTLAEDLEGRERQDALRQFLWREAPGLAILKQRGLEPQFFTQPGGNWIPQVAQAGPDLGLKAFISESWNTYLKPLAEPMWLGRVLYWAGHVDVPKGFLFHLPEGADSAPRLVEQAWQAGRLPMLVTHPTELVTRRFWDAESFSGGTNQPIRVPGTVRPAAEWSEALWGFRHYLSILKAEGARWVTVSDWLRQAASPDVVTEVAHDELMRSLKAGLGPMRIAGGSLSAAEALYAALKLEAGDSATVLVPRLAAPTGSLASDHPDDVVRCADVQGALPEWIHGEPLHEAARRFLVPRVGRVYLALFDYVRPPEELHWDWPIFSPGFTAPGLLQETLRETWTLKPVLWRQEENPSGDSMVSRISGSV